MPHLLAELLFVNLSSGFHIVPLMADSPILFGFCIILYCALKLREPVSTAFYFLEAYKRNAAVSEICSGSQAS